MKNVIEIKHPLIQSHLSVLRDKNTSCDQFRSVIRRVSRLLTYEATVDLETRAIEVETPICKTTGCALKQRIGLVPICAQDWVWWIRC